MNSIFNCGIFKMLGNIFQQKTKFPTDFDSKLSESWREFYSPKIFGCLAEKLPLEHIKEMYSLVFFIANDINFIDAINYLDKKNFTKLSEMLARNPLESNDVVFYPKYDLIYIIGFGTQYAALISEDETEKVISLKYFKEITAINLDLFLGKRLIYPI